MRTVQFGISLVPNIADMSQLRELARLADALGLDLLGIQDHPYVSRFFDTMSLISVLLAETGRLRIFPNVASLPLRPPALLAKSAASLDMLSGGRFELGIGAGASWEGIAAMGGQRRTPGEAIQAQEAIDHGARQAGRDPSSVLRVANLVGSITNRRGSGQPHGNSPLEGTSAYWIEVLTSLALATRFDAFIFWPQVPSDEQIERFAREVAPGVRVAVEKVR